MYALFAAIRYRWRQLWCDHPSHDYHPNYCDDCGKQRN
jgi:hypothetical protein